MNSTPALAETDGHALVYPRGWVRGSDSAHVLQAISSDAIEDYLLFDKAPEIPEVVYEVELSSSVFALRLVANVLELLDPQGIPRLRMAAPYLVDGKGERRDAAVSVSGCEVDRDPVPPWGRAIVPTGSSICELKISWSREVPYPAILDPAWGVTGAMVAKRYDHTATLLDSGKVLITGGQAGPWCSDILASSEIYDPASGTFSATGPMGEARTGAAAARLPSGAVLVTGGMGPSYGNCSDASSTESYDSATGVWKPEPGMPQAHVGHVMVVLGNGDVLAIGGSWNLGNASTDLFLAAVPMWVKIGGYSARVPIAERRDDGKVVVLGGAFYNSGSGYTTPLDAIWTYDPVSRTFSGASSTLQHPWGGKVAVVAMDGSRLLVLGGGTQHDQAEIIDLQTLATTVVSPMPKPRSGLTATLLPGGDVLVAGGGTGPEAVRYHPATDTWSTAGSMTVDHAGHTATLLPSGKVLIVGGLVLSAELFDPEVPNPACGNGVVDSTEACDGMVFGGKSCLSFGFLSGKLECSPSCTIDTSHCSMIVPGTDGGLAEAGTLCGNNYRDPSEVCDGADLGGHFCTEFGYPSGNLSCRPDCAGFEVSACVKGPSCGDGACNGTETCHGCPEDCGACCANGKLDPGEPCDGSELGGQSCASLGFASGTLSCNANCTGYVSTGCVPHPKCGDGTCNPSENCLNCPDDCKPCCGNGKVDPGEQCDGALLSGGTCGSLGSVGGKLSCSASCEYDTTGCCSGLQSYQPSPDKPTEALVPTVTLENGAGYGVEFGFEGSNTPLSQKSDACVAARTTEGDINLCLLKGKGPGGSAVKDCFELGLAYKLECSGNPVCSSPPLATCDYSAGCCKESLSGTPSFERSWSFDSEFFKKYVGEWVAPSVELSVGFEGSVKTETDWGKACSCPYGSAMDVSLGMVGSGSVKMDVSANRKLFGIKVSVSYTVAEVKATACGMLGLGQEMVCGKYEPSLLGGVRMGLKLPAAVFQYFHVDPGQLQLAIPDGYSGCTLD